MTVRDGEEQDTKRESLTYIIRAGSRLAGTSRDRIGNGCEFLSLTFFLTFIESVQGMISTGRADHAGHVAEVYTGDKGIERLSGQDMGRVHGPESIQMEE